MLLEIRTYRVHPGCMDAFWRGWEDTAKRLALEFLSPLVGFFAADTGDLNEVKVIFKFADHAARKSWLELMESREIWRRQMLTMQELILEQHTQFFSSPSFPSLVRLGQGNLYG